MFSVKAVYSANVLQEPQINSVNPQIKKKKTRDFFDISTESILKTYFNKRSQFYAVDNRNLNIF